VGETKKDKLLALQLLGADMPVPEYASNGQLVLI
jgi:hypothetical protein